MDTSFVLIGLQNALTIQNILLITLGTAIGIVVGALPGLSATMALALLLPITFPLAPDSGLAMLAALYLSADRKSTRLNSSHVASSYSVFCLKTKTPNY